MRDCKPTPTRFSAARGASGAIARPRCPMRPPSYAAWTVEELRELAEQLQLPDATVKTRCELLEILAGEH